MASQATSKGYMHPFYAPVVPCEGDKFGLWSSTWFFGIYILGHLQKSRSIRLILIHK